MNIADSDVEIQSMLDAIPIAGQALRLGEEGAREKLLALSYSLTAALELPSEAISRIGWAEPAKFACMRTGIDLKLFELLAKKDETGTSAAQIAAKCGADEVLIARMLKHLAAMNVVEENAADLYRSSNFSEALVEPKYRDGVTYCFDVAGPSFHKMPAYFKKTDYKCPTEIANGPFQYAHDTKLPFFGWLAQTPPYLHCFNNYMTGYRAGKRSWLDPGCYPIEERLGQAINAGDEVLIVDVGGGMGHDLEELKKKHPGLRGRCILQELKDVVGQIPKTNTTFEAAVHDFFTPQPVQAARAYHLHSVLHDWDDEHCRKILLQLVPALKRGFSKILINDFVVPDFRATWSVTSMDWLMLALGAVRERTEKDWYELVRSAGLEITKIWTFEQGAESLIEVELAGENAEEVWPE